MYCKYCNRPILLSGDGQSQMCFECSEYFNRESKHLFPNTTKQEEKQGEERWTPSKKAVDKAALLLNEGKIWYSDAVLAFDEYEAQLSAAQATIAELQERIKREDANHYHTRCAWDRTTQERDDWEKEAKALAAIKKGLETSLTEAFATIAEQKAEIERLNRVVSTMYANSVEFTRDKSGKEASEGGKV